ncbi:P-loop containing nucleoside triphosphate hydrolase protein [Zychaea mexicana]|uniref:P-loop containing nucleoside triphosphate hydrolase protein n=1 Tax=Zychaea mexicana TaxID=64656 RepID=UPI0022FEF5C2|nr:P-loop containing nucleoside triphosphate hydrolase protein [Zychaea mexicana]KAI9496898.1 P-loop containing nucleoside triphosphate hydrolase protein [Zychaea mexicana]
MAPLEVIGAAYSRSGTDSLRAALDILGYRTLHAKVMLMEKVGRPELFEDAYDHPDKPVDWNYLFDGFDAAVEFPAICFVRPLLEAYPNAKVILIERDADSWYESVKNNVIKMLEVAEARELSEHGTHLIRAFEKLWLDGVLLDPKLRADAEEVKSRYKAHNAWVKEHVPQERLLALKLEEGINWDKMCAFLGKPVPAEPYPRINSSKEFNEEIPNFAERLEDL